MQILAERWLGPARWQALAFALALIAAIGLLLESEVEHLFGMVAVPVLLTLLPLLSGRRHRPTVSVTCTGVFLVAVMVGASLSMFFLPSFFAALVAAVSSILTARRPHPARP